MTKLIIARKAMPTPGLCRLVVDGRSCTEQIYSRGVCKKHYDYLRKNGILDDFALPRSRRPKKMYKVKSVPEPGVCRVIENGVPCTKASKRRGLCLTHYANIWQRPDLNLDDFAKPVFKQEFSRKPHPKPGICRIIQNGVPCNRKVKTRGLCAAHYAMFSRQRELLEEWALPVPGEAVYTVKTRPKPGICPIVQDGQPCTSRAHSRGFCLRHYTAIRKKRPDLFAKLSLPPKKCRHTLERKPENEWVENVCVIIDNNIACTNPPERRGICKRHREMIWNMGKTNPNYRLEHFEIPENKREPVFKRKKIIEEGICILVEDDVECLRLARIRGLCRHHETMLRKRGLVEQYALPPRATRDTHALRPHIYLDKNVIFDYAARKVLGSQREINSVILVQAILERKIRGTVSLDCVRSVYGYLKFRLMRDPADGGKGYDDEAAEREARAFIGELFFAVPGAWIFAKYTDDMLRSCTTGGKFEELSLEDAIEFQAYLAARARKVGPKVFVTSDKHFAEGVHPAHAVQAYLPEMQNAKPPRTHLEEIH